MVAVECGITRDGAILVATVYPIALLVLAFESKPRDRRQKLVWWWTGLRVGVFVTEFSVSIWAIWSVFICVQAVMNGELVSGANGASVRRCGTYLALLAGVVIFGRILELFAHDIGRDDRSSKHGFSTEETPRRS